MRLDGFGLMVNDMASMIRFYRDALGFEIKEGEDTSNVYSRGQRAKWLLADIWRLPRGSNTPQLAALQI